MASSPDQEWVRAAVQLHAQHEDPTAYDIAAGVGLTDLAWRLTMQQLKENDLRRLIFEGREPGTITGRRLSVPQAAERVANASQDAEILGPLESFEAGYPQLTLHARRASGEHVLGTFTVGSAAPARLVDEIVGFHGALGNEAYTEDGRRLPWERLEQNAYAGWLEFASGFVTRNTPAPAPSPKPSVVQATRTAPSGPQFIRRPRTDRGQRPGI